MGEPYPTLLGAVSAAGRVLLLFLEAPRRGGCQLSGMEKAASRSAL